MFSFRSRLLIAPLVLMLVAPVHSAGAQAADSTRLTVFLDCGFYCDFDYLRTELTAVDWVRTRQSADVQLLVTAQQTGSGGTEYTMAFIGLGKLATMADTMRFNSAPNESIDDTRKKMLQTICATKTRRSIFKRSRPCSRSSWT